MQSNILFRASEVGELMAYPDKNQLPKGAMTFLEIKESQIQLEWKDKLDLDVMQKGIDVEDASIALFNEVTGNFFFKNTERKNNDFITGECDIFDQDSSTIWDIKSSYSKKTHKMRMDIASNKTYFWQLVSYAELWDAKHAGLARCLVDTPEHLINQFKDDVDWHVVSHIEPRKRCAYASMEVTAELREQLMNRVKLAQNKLMEMLNEY